MPSPNQTQHVIPSNPMSDPKVRRRRYPKRNVKKGSPRYGERYKVKKRAGDLVHIYADGTVIGKGVSKGAGKKKHRSEGAKKGGGGVGGGGRASSPYPLAMRREAKARAGTEFNPLIGEKNAEIRRQKAHGKTIEQAFNEYTGFVKAAQAAQQQATAQAQQSQDAAAARSGQATAGLNSEANAEMAKRAALLGNDSQTVDTATSLQGQTGVAGANQNATQTQLLQSLGLADSNDLGRRGVAGAREKVQAGKDNRDAVERLYDERTDVKRQRARRRSDILGQLKQAAAENYIALRGLTLDSQGDAADRDLERFKAELGFRSDALDREADINMNNADNAAKGKGGKGGSGGGGGFSSNIVRYTVGGKKVVLTRSQFNSARSKSADLRGKGKKMRQLAAKHGWQKAREMMVKRGTSRDEIDAVHDVAKYGHLASSYSEAAGLFPGGWVPDTLRG